MARTADCDAGHGGTLHVGPHLMVRMSLCRPIIAIWWMC